MLSLFVLHLLALTACSKSQWFIRLGFIVNSLRPKHRWAHLFYACQIADWPVFCEKGAWFLDRFPELRMLCYQKWIFQILEENWWGILDDLVTIFDLWANGLSLGPQTVAWERICSQIGLAWVESKRKSDYWVGGEKRNVIKICPTQTCPKGKLEKGMCLLDFFKTLNWSLHCVEDWISWTQEKSTTSIFPSSIFLIN